MTTNNNIITIIFSKNRPLQLDLLLNSFYLHCMQSYSTDIHIIYTYDDQYKNSYNQLIQEQEEKERDNIKFIYEKDYPTFKSTFVEKIKDYEYVMFLVDDNIFTHPFDLLQISDLLKLNHDVLGFSLRLGKNTNICYPLNTQQEIPKSIEYDSNINYFSTLNDLQIFAFYWIKAQLDFNYALEVSSSVYRVKDLINWFRDLVFNNPNELEAVLYDYSYYFYGKPKLLSYCTSAAFCAPMNKVQNVALNNRSNNMNMFSQESMLTMYKNGFRINPIEFDGVISNGCHQEVALYTLEEYEKYGL